MPDREDRDDVLKNVSNFQVSTYGYLDYLKKRKSNPQMHGLPLPTARIAKLLGKLRIGEVSVLGGLEGHGKSAFAEQCAFTVSKSYEAVNLALEENPGEKGWGAKPQAVVIFTLEMSREQLISRAIAQESGFPLRKLLDPELLEDEDWAFLAGQVEEIGSWPILIVDDPAIDEQDIEKVLHAVSLEYEVRLVIVDYLQILLGGDQENEVRFLSRLVRNLKETARRRNCHIMILSSLNRDLSDNGVPTGRNIRGSGAVSFHADVVAMLHRPRVADHSIDKAWDNIAILNVAKNRNGPVGEVKLRWNPDYLRFEDLSDYDERQLPPLPSRTSRGR